MPGADRIGDAMLTTVLSLATDAIAYASVLFIISVGLSLSMGIMRVINLAHGAFAMVGGYIASTAAQTLGWPYALALIAAVGGTVALAMPIERLLFRPIYGSSALTQVLMTIGITFVLIGAANLLFGPTLKTIPLPGMLRGSVDLGFRTVSAHRLFVVVCAVLTALTLWWIVERTGFGRRLRATVDNADMAAALGVRTSVVYAGSFALATGLAAFGGVLGSELLPIEPYYALQYMVTFLVVVCVGGAGSIGGIVAACLILGTVDTVARYLVPSYGAFFFYAAVILIVLVVPNGLFGRRLPS